MKTNNLTDMRHSKELFLKSEFLCSFGSHERMTKDVQ
jgi:hypothetical protein